MPLKLIPPGQRHGSPFYYLRGSVRGIRVDESTGTYDKKTAEAIRVRREKELQDRSVYGDSATRTFGEAALEYIRAGGDDQFLNPISRAFGRKKLFEITQGEIDALAKKLFKTGGPATRNRKVYTPVSAVLHHAARLKWCEKPVIARPVQPKGRIRSVTREEARALISASAPHLRPLVTFLFSTGCRLSEALYLDWANVDLSDGEVLFRDTKNTEDRVVPLPPEAVAALANMPHREGAVFRTQKGLPYESRNGEGGGQVKTAWKGMCTRAKITDFSPHDCRHTFATWYLKKHRKDYLGLMKICGWKSVEMVQRYAHLDVSDVKPRISKIWGKSGDAKTVEFSVVEGSKKN